MGGVLPGARQAPEHCLHAAAVDPEDPTPWVVLQTIAQGLQYDNDEYRKIFGEVVSRAPYHVHAAIRNVGSVHLLVRGCICHCPMAV